jgi:hypothetical protein
MENKKEREARIDWDGHILAHMGRREEEVDG